VNTENWYSEVDFPVTLCDKNGFIVAMNQASIKLFEPDGGASLIGKSLLNCHPEPAKSMLTKMLKTKTAHTYIDRTNMGSTLVHETPWYIDGKYMGFVEILINLSDSFQSQVNIL
jgi:transcriptional regulator with PAS, ATPase and Fis domain